MTGTDRQNNLRILIVGAGPVGLALGVELARRGFKPHIIDKNSGPTPISESRALAVNQRTRDLMRESGVTQMMLDAAYPIKGAIFHWNGKEIAHLNISDHPRPDARLITLPQGKTESILIEILAQYGFEVSWNTELTDVSDIDERPIASFTDASGNATTKVCDYVFGCDGAHSAVRKSAGIGFFGTTNDTVWTLCDAQYEDDKSNGLVKAFLSATGVSAQIPVDGKTIRVIANASNAIDEIPYRDKMIDTPWKSEFSISYRMVERFVEGRVALCGDAAHLHSPAGGRGMNLGIEDAAWLAWAVEVRAMGIYNTARLTAAKKVLAQTRSQTRLITGKVPFAGIIVRYILPVALKIPFVKNALLTNLLGLDTNKAPWLGG